MKKITFLMAMMFFAMTSAIYAQTITGTVNDETGPLPGANVLVKGTTNGTQTDFDGKFSLKVSEGSGTVVISFVGYAGKQVSYTVAAGETKDLGTIMLVSDNTLDEVVIVGSIIDVAKDRETPVAVSTIKASEIEAKLGSQEFPEILKTTPSVYATKSGGGFGDSRINIRGFDQTNTAVLINGVPVNDMENGRVYWSNWAGLSDVTSAMQVQRGLGSSKLAISSVGGTINVITRSSANRKGGRVGASFGNDGYMKYKASYSTGKMDNGLSASILLSRTQGDGYVDGTKFVGHNYFIALGYELNDNNSLEFTFTGAPQWHHQRSFAERISTYQKYGSSEEPNIKYNGAWGYLDGKEFSWRRNFYHKPVMSLNYDLKFSEKSSLSTVLYASWGRGGGSGPIGTYFYKDKDDETQRFQDFMLPRTNDGLVDFEFVRRFNRGQETIVAPRNSDVTLSARADRINSRSNAGFTRRASMNSHNWYGAVINYHNDISDNLSFDFGADVRAYKGIHYRVVNNILGASGYTDSRDRNNPNRSITEFVEVSPSFNPWQSITDQQKIEYYNDGNVRWYGAFGQLEYKNDKVSTFVQGAVSQQGFQRVDYFNLGAHNGTSQESEFKNILGGNVKAGINFNINEQHNVFANAGYYSRQPNFRAVYTSFTNNDINPFLENETVIGLEAGYGFKHENYSVKLNAYRTSWADRFQRTDGSVRGNFVQVRGLEQVHTGLELEATGRFDRLTVNLMGSLGNYEYKGNAVGTEYDRDNELVSSDIPFYLDGVKVGDAAQTTANLGLNYKITDNLSIDYNQFFAGNLYPVINPTDFKTQANNAKGSLKLPGYSLVDLGASYKWNLNDNMNLSFRVNVNNVTNKTYISEGFTNIHVSDRTNSTYNGIDTKNRVYFGYGRTWNASVRFSF